MSTTSSTNTTAENEGQPTTKGKAPVNTIRLGGIEASTWMDVDSEGHVQFTNKVQRRYRDKDGNWKSSEHFFDNQMPIVEELSHRAWVWCLEERQRQAAAARSVE